MSRIKAVTKDIDRNAEILLRGLREKGLEAPSYYANGQAEFPVAKADKATLAARDRLLAFTSELHDIVLGPRETLKELAWNVRSHKS
jgi:hypothetical protein